MQDMIAKGVTWFEQQRKEHLSVFVKYRPAAGGVDATVPATVGGSRFESIDSTGQVLRIETRDFLIAVDDRPAVPARGDRIIETGADAVKRIYEVSIAAGAGNQWQWADRSQRLRRIHTMYVGVDP